MAVQGKKVAVLVDNYFEQAEFEEPIDALKEAGVEVDVVSAGPRTLQGLNHVDKGDTFEADILLKDAVWDEYDALVLPGGAINADSLRMNDTAQAWVSDFLDTGKPVAAICHAPWLLVSADAVAGRRLTSFETIQDDIRNAGGEWTDLAAIVDINLLTSRKPDDLPAFSQALLEMLDQDDALIENVTPHYSVLQ